MNKVIVYTVPLWPWCRKVKSYLKEQDVPFEEINILLNREAGREMVQKSGQKGVPVVDINGSIVVGFNRDEIDKLLGL